VEEYNVQTQNEAIRMLNKHELELSYHIQPFSLKTFFAIAKHSKLIVFITGTHPKFRCAMVSIFWRVLKVA
jgi:hypothetical protein